MNTLAILITYHNEGPWLRECIESVRNQTGAPDEILVYDDASSDPAADHVPPGVRVIRGDHNIGPARARNVLLKAATSDFVHFHDADDWFAPGWCTAVRAAMELADIIITDVAISGEHETPHAMNVAGMRDPVSFAIRGAVLVPSTTYRKSLSPGFNESLHQSEDWDYHIRLLARSPARLSSIPHDLVVVRAHDNNRSKDVVSVWSSAIAAMESMDLPAVYDTDIALKATEAGRNLYRAGAVAEARRAFDVARKRSGDGHVPFTNPVMYWLARLLGPITALKLRA